MNAKVFLFLLFNAVFSCYALKCVPDSFSVLRGNNTPSLQDIKPEASAQFLQDAACTGEKVLIEMLADEQVAFVQHGVDVVIDCAPLLGNAGKPLGGSFEWSMTSLVPTSNGLEEKTAPKLIKKGSLPSRKTISGDFNRFLNITSTDIFQGRRDPDNGKYTCQVCTTSGCSSASVILYLVGAEPTLQTGEGNVVAEDGAIYSVGTDICVERGTNDSIRLTCEVASYSESGSPPFPSPSRQWYKDDELIYSVGKIGSSVYNGLNLDFYNVGSNSLLMPGVLLPMPCLLRNDGSIEINFQTLRIMVQERVPEGVTDDNLQEMLFDTLLGEYRCQVGNVLGSTEATTTISQC